MKLPAISYPSMQTGVVQHRRQPRAKRLRRGRLRAAGRDDRELVGAEPRQKRSVASRCQPAPDLDEKAVARRMTVDVVDFLELIEVDAKHRETAHCRPTARWKVFAMCSLNAARLGRPVSWS